MRRVEPRQLTFVFADSPEGGKGSRKRDESRGRPYLLHIAKAMTATSSTTTESKPERLLESMTHPANLATALRNVARNKGAPGVDGESVEEVVDNAHRLLPRLRRALLEGSYRPGELQDVHPHLRNDAREDGAVLPAIERKDRTLAQNDKIGCPASCQPQKP